MLPGVLVLLLCSAPDPAVSAPTVPLGDAPSFDGAGRTSQPADASWSDAELKRGDFEGCLRDGYSVHRCYRESGVDALGLYRQAFEGSRRTNVDAIRRCRSLSEAIITRASAEGGGPACLDPQDPVPVACEAFQVECKLEEIKTDGSTHPWWAPLERGVRYVRRGEYATAQVQLQRALDQYVNSMNDTGSFVEAWNIFRESERATIAQCDTHCGPGKQSLGARLHNISGLFERFNEGCHRDAAPEILEACAERNLLRFKSAMVYVSKERDNQAAAVLLADAYGDCVDITSGRPEDLTAGVLTCWRTYGRRSLVLRGQEAQVEGPVDPQQIEKARAIATRFVFTDMKRTCSGGTQQPEVKEACAFLARLDEKSRDKSLRTIIPAVFAAAPGVGLTRGAGGGPTDLRSLLDSPLYDQILSGRPVPPEAASAQKEQIAAARGARGEKGAPGAAGGAGAGPGGVAGTVEAKRAEGPERAAESGCKEFESSQQWQECSITRMLDFGSESLDALSKPVESTGGTGPARRPVRLAGAITLGVFGGGGLMIAGVAASIAASARSSFAAERSMNWEWTAEEARGSAAFQRGERANRTMIAGFVIGGVGVLVGTAMLVGDLAANRQRRGPRRAGMSAGGLSVAF